MSKYVRITIKSFCWLCGFFFILFIFVNLSLISIGFLLGLPVSYWQAPTAFLTAAASLVLATRKFFQEESPRLTIVFAAILAAIVIALLGAGFFYDVSYDGRLYHQNSIIHLASGWNPVHDPQTPNGSHPAYETPRRSIWSVVYPRSAETCAASLYALTGKIELGKMFNILLLFASFFLSIASLLSFENMRRNDVLVFAALAAFNPVATCTLFSYYVDGQVASLITCLFAVGALMFREKKKLHLLLFVMTLALLIDTKFTGLAYAVVSSAGMTIGFLLIRQWRQFLKTAVACLLAGIVGFAVFGFNPYITNWKHFGHPLHPIAGKDKMKGINLRKFLSVPKNLRDKNSLEKFAISLVSRSEFVTFPDSTRVKIPFTIDGDEIRQFSGPHVRAGGFGPLFGGVFLLAAVILVISAIHRGQGVFFIFLFTLLVFGSALVNWEFWWARLAPQIWLLPLVLLVYPFLRITQPDSGAWLRRTSSFGVILLILNTFVVAVSYFYHQTIQSAELHSELKRIAISGRRIEVNVTEFTSARVMLVEAGIPFREIENMPRDQRTRPLGHGVWYRFENSGKL